MFRERAIWTNVCYPVPEMLYNEKRLPNMAMLINASDHKEAMAMVFTELMEDMEDMDMVRKRVAVVEKNV